MGVAVFLPTMSLQPETSSSKKRRSRLAAEIERNGRPVFFPCERCSTHNHLCIIMSNSTNLRCSECVRQGKKCVNMSWESLDRTREEYQRKVDEDEELLATVMARLMRNKKILRQAEGRAARKAECLASEMEAEGVFETDDCPAAAATLGLTPLMMETLGNMDQSINFSGGTGVASSGN